MSRFASALYRISPEQSPRIRYTLWSRWFEKPRVPLKRLSFIHDSLTSTSISIEIFNRYIFITILELWPCKRSGFVRWIEAKKKIEGQMKLFVFFITMKKKMLGYETRLWKYKFAYLNQEDFFCTFDETFR